MSIVLDIVRTYRAPGEVQARRMAGGPREDRALAVLLGGCAMIYVAQWPRFSREAFLDPSQGVEALMAGGLFAWLMVMPLVFYVLSLLLALAMKVLGTGVSGFQCRMALFWSVLATAPLWLLAGLLAGFAPGPGPAIVSTLALGAIVVFTSAGLVRANAMNRGAV